MNNGNNVAGKVEGRGRTHTLGTRGYGGVLSRRWNVQRGNCRETRIKIAGFSGEISRDGETAGPGRKEKLSFTCAPASSFRSHYPKLSVSTHQHHYQTTLPGFSRGRRIQLLTFASFKLLCILPFAHDFFFTVVQFCAFPTENAFYLDAILMKTSWMPQSLTNNDSPYSVARCTIS